MKASIFHQSLIAVPSKKDRKKSEVREVIYLSSRMGNLQAEAMQQLSMCRREVLSLIEAIYGQTSQWKYTRTQLLHLLGEKGLEGRIQRVFRESGDESKRNVEATG